MTKIHFRGDQTPPEFEHGEEVIVYDTHIGTIQHRRHNGRHWEYGVYVDALPYTVWVTTAKRTRTQSQEDV